MTANNTFANLKQNRKSSFDKLSEELAKASGKTEYKNDDDRFWYPAVDKVGNGYAVVRFLPAPEGEDVPFVRLFEHGFQGPTGSWYIEKSLTTLGQQDPVSEYNTKLWNTGLESDKDKARKQKRRLHFISNIYVITDSANPENEGKVKLFKYGKKIFDKLYEANNPTHPDEVKLDPFDLWEGANLKIKIRNVEGYRNYDSSSFEAASPLFDNDKKMEDVWKQESSLQEFINKKNFKTYEELQAKFHRVLGLGQAGIEQSVMPTAAAVAVKAVAPKKAPELVAEVEGDDDDLALFKSLAEEDEGLIA
jgi:hypothetical protein